MGEIENRFHLGVKSLLLYSALVSPEMPVSLANHGERGLAGAAVAGLARIS
jgi:hypothetical protein